MLQKQPQPHPKFKIIQTATPDKLEKTVPSREILCFQNSSGKV